MKKSKNWVKNDDNWQNRNVTMTLPWDSVDIKMWQQGMNEQLAKVERDNCEKSRFLS